MKYSDEYFMNECLKLAKRGMGKVSPNPLVGCVIVKNGNIIGEGYHKEFGGPHAEVNAISNSEDISGSTVYVNLEPCSYYGKTPPCTDLLIANKVKKVVCGTIDPNPLVKGKGIRKLRKAGIEIRVGVLEEECRIINEKFFKFITTGYPFITVKIAQTLDGKISSGKNDKNGITSLSSRKIVHRLRSEHDAVLIGSNTLKCDNPELTVRHCKGSQPFRIVLTSGLDINPKSIILNDEFRSKTILITSTRAYIEKSEFIESLINKRIRVYPFNAYKSGLLPLKKILSFLSKINISSVLVEGGGGIFSSFISEGLYDRLLVFISPKIFGGGIPVLSEKYYEKPLSTEFQKYSFENIGPDLLFTGEHSFKLPG